MPVLYIDESSINLGIVQRRVWQQPSDPVKVSVNSPHGPNLSWIAAVCNRMPPYGDSQLVYSIEESTNQLTFRRFLDKLVLYFRGFDDDQMILLVWDGHGAHLS
jgi:hypothetical protein